MTLGLKIAFQNNTIYNALKVSIIFGLILNFINQGDAIFNAQIDQINPAKALLTCIVPYLVYTYSATQAKLAFKIGEIASVNVDLECKHCGSSTQKLVVETKIPICPNCYEFTHWKLRNIKNNNNISATGGGFRIVQIMLLFV